MLSRYIFLRLLWIVGTFAASIAFVEPLETLVPVYTIVGIVIVPLIITLIGETLDEEGKSERWQRIGLWMQMGGALSLIAVNVASLILMQKQAFNDKWMFYVMVSLGMIPLLVLCTDCYLGLFRNKRLTLPPPSDANNWTAVGISVCFVVCVLVLIIGKNFSIGLEIYAAGLFFAMCAAICLNSWWVNKQLSGKPRISARQVIGGFDLIMFIGGAAGGALVLLSIIVKGGFVASYDVMVGALFFLLALFFAIHRIGRALRKWRSFVATRDGLLEMHNNATLLIRWENIAEASLVPVTASVQGIAVALNIELPSIEPNIRPGVDKTWIDKWRKKQLKDWVSTKNQFQADVLILDARCLYGIVNLWHTIRAVLADEARRMELPPTSEFTG